MAKQPEENGTPALSSNGSPTQNAQNAANSMGAMGFGDISMIRNILMGQQIATWEENFKLITARQDKEHAENSAALKSLEASIRQQLRDLEKRTEDRFSLVEALINDRVEMLQKSIANTSQADRHALGKLLGEVSVALLKA